MAEQPTIQQFMAPQPHYVEASDTAAKAQKLMKEHRIRHLPVVEHGKVMGILTDRDIKLAFSLFATHFQGKNPDMVPVKDVCTVNPYVVEPETPLRDVVHEMARNRIGSVIVVQNDELIGIFTTVDACMALYVFLASGGNLGGAEFPHIT